ncbi:RagB/SusD family nutrient uptake outer membrane protein [Labilibaculum sp. DW002]|uniref:RagB/SusD family nutrient uptake outer membrane protein n=1 Tax=Paralabilibaculum antarcticum TaxID=2912572 RepID=A0ABT5VR10_9BACT|nr:RagB/SusD family nutrient uptake outer membrane protein [Labilibaculum sp. DW002]MDE5416729.1 RagB/SusD family nutrient uptake outer membrane protein [Labilibaculum sp. DW002]
MKKILYTLFILAITLMACDDKLELTPTSSLTFNGFWESEEAVNAAHSGVYSAFRGYSYTMWQMGELRSDIWGGKTFESPSNEWVIEHTIDVENVPWSNWSGFYSLIHKLNDFIANAPNVEFLDDTKKQHMLGEAYGMRAYVYFTMLKVWGGVPLSTLPQTTLKIDELSKARDTEEAVMAQVKADLAASLEKFGSDDSYFNGKRVYWSENATQTLKGEVFIWSGTHMGGGNADYTIAKTALTSIANADLLNNYADIFNFENKNNEELIFAFDYAIDEASNFYSLFTSRTTELLGKYDQNGLLVQDYLESTNAANRYGVSESILLKMNDPQDTRRNATFVLLYTAAPADPVYVESDPAYSASYLNKFMGMVDAGSRNYVSDIPLYRYADVLLLLAEAKNLLGEDPSSEINRIIERAYGSNYVEAIHNYTNSTKEANIQKILDERLKEFIGEGKRWWDLRRAGDQYVIDNNQYLNPGDEYKLLVPISRSMMGRNPLLEQTPGYSN